MSRVEIQTLFELSELRKSPEYRRNYIEVYLGGQAQIQVYEIRPYAFEFFRAMEPFFEITVYSFLHH